MAKGFSPALASGRDKSSATWDRREWRQAPIFTLSFTKRDVLWIRWAGSFHQRTLFPKMSCQSSSPWPQLTLKHFPLGLKKAWPFRTSPAPAVSNLLLNPELAQQPGQIKGALFQL